MKKYNFNKNANEYDLYYLSDYGKRVDKIEKQCIENFISMIEKKEALEIGCGTGHWTEFFVRNGFFITAIDIAKRMLDIAKKKNIKNTEFLKADVVKLPFKDNSFENIFAVTSLEFVENQGKAFAEIFRVLKKGGYLLVAGLNAESELGKNRWGNETFRNAEFFTYESLFNYLSKLNKPMIKTCLRIKSGKIIDNQSINEGKMKGADTFIVGMVKK